jgi:F-type H+-transporting ATPase subunit gamma
MNSPRDLRRRIRSISGTAQITRAMQMVAASKMRKAQQSALAAGPFARLLYRIQRSATARSQDFRHPLQEQREQRRLAVILIAADKGLCGALNTNVFRLAAAFDQESTLFITAGRKAAQFVARSRRQLAAEFSYGDSPAFAEARAIAAFARELFLCGQVDAVRIVATRFVNTLTQEPVTLEYLPVGPIIGIKIPGTPGVSGAGVDEDDEEEALFEPCANDVMTYLIGHYLNIYIYFALLNAKASEQSARMVSMKNATDSAEALIDTLRLDYNKLRQGNITKELLEIAGGQAE